MSATISEIHDGSARLRAYTLGPDGDSDSLVLKASDGDLSIYIGLDTFTDVSKADFAEAILRVVAPERLAPKPEPKLVLPTEEGFYTDRDGDVWRLYEGEFSIVSGEHDNCPRGIHEPESYLPFRRMTAEEVAA